MKVLGVIGGMGPMATAYFLQLVTQMSEARADREHIEVLVHSKPTIPDRTGFILGKSKQDPLPELINVGQGLVRAGAQVLAIPCVTAHYFYSGIQEAVEVPVINVIDETILCLKAAGVEKAGLLATDGTVAGGHFQKAFREAGITLLLPGQESQKALMRLIYDEIKAGMEPTQDCLDWISRDLWEQGSEVVMLGCTELSLLKKKSACEQNGAWTPAYLDMLKVLARSAVLRCGKLRPEYEELLCLAENRQV